MINTQVQKRYFMKKKCDICGKEPIDYFFSLDKYWCVHCKKMYDFKLKPGQKSLLIKNKVGENEDRCNNTDK